MEVLKQLHQLLKQDQSIKRLSNLANVSAPAIASKSPQQFYFSSEYERLCCELEELKFDQIKQTFKKLPQVPHTTAMIIKANKDFTLALLIMPQNKCFDWHDHNFMNGISCCVSGQLQVRSLDPNYLKPCQDQEENIFQYPKQMIRQETLSPRGQRLSKMCPHSYNIHEIKARRQSCFIDLLMPEYPDDKCHYFKTIQIGQSGDEQEVEDKIKLKKLDNIDQQVFGIESLVKHFRETSKSKPKTLKL